MTQPDATDNYPPMHVYRSARQAARRALDEEPGLTHPGLLVRHRITDAAVEATWQAALSADVPRRLEQARAVATDLIDTFLKIAAYGLHDSNRDELRNYALAARDDLAVADASEVKP